jgi:SOS response regulatory protein OraA/RecX
MATKRSNKRAGGGRIKATLPKAGVTKNLIKRIIPPLRLP